MKRISITWLCLSLLFVKGSAAPQRNEVSDKVSTSVHFQNDLINGIKNGSKHMEGAMLNEDFQSGSDSGKDNGQYSMADGVKSLISVQNSDSNLDLEGDNVRNPVKVAQASGAESSTGSNTGPSKTGIDHKHDNVAQGLDKSEKATTDTSVSPKENAGNHETEVGAPKANVSISGDKVVANHSDTTTISDGSKSNSGQDSVVICIEMTAPDAFRAGLIRQTERTSSESSSDKLGNSRSKSNTMFKNILQALVHSSKENGIFNTIMNSVSVDRNETTNTMENVKTGKNPLVDAAKNPYVDYINAGNHGNAGELNVNKNISDVPDFEKKTTDLLHTNKNFSKRNEDQIMPGNTKRHSEKNSARLQSIRNKVIHALREFFPVSESVRVSIRPGNSNDKVSAVENPNLWTEPESVVRDVLGIDKMNSFGTSKGLEKTPKPWSRFDNIGPRIEDIIQRSFKRGRSMFGSLDYKPLDLLTPRIDSSLQGTDNLQSSPDIMSVKTNNGKSSTDSTKAIKEHITLQSSKSPTKFLGPSADMQPQSLPDMMPISNPDNDPYMKGINNFQRQFSIIYSRLINSLMGPFLQSISRSFTDSTLGMDKRVGTSQPLGNKATRPDTLVF